MSGGEGQTVREFSKALRPGDSLTHDGKHFDVVNSPFGYRVRPVERRTRKRGGTGGAKSRKGGDAPK